MIDLNTAKRLLNGVGMKSAPGTNYKVRFEDTKSGSYFISQKLSIPKDLPTGKTIRRLYWNE